MSNTGVRAIAGGCKGLKSLNLSCLNKLTDAGVRAIVGSLAGSLVDLNLLSCKKVRCPLPLHGQSTKRRCVCLAHNHPVAALQVSDTGARATGDLASEHVALYFSKKVTSGRVAELRRRHPSWTIVR